MVRVLSLFLTRFKVNELKLLFKCKFIIERFSLDCRKTKTKVNTLANQRT